MTKVATIINAHTSCPAQWSGETSAGERVYVRYRHGLLSVEVNNILVESVRLGGVLDGCMTYEELKSSTKGIEWPENES